MEYFHIRNLIDNWAAEKAKTDRKNCDFKLLQNGKGRNLFYNVLQMYHKTTGQQLI